MGSYSQSLCLGTYSLHLHRMPEISIKMENVPISQVIKEIENQTRYLFINKGVDTKNKVSINAVQKTIQDVLAQLFAGTEIAYRIDESYIILTKKNDAGNPVSVTLEKSGMQKVIRSSEPVSLFKELQ